MNIQFQKAKNGEDTALAENLFLHSNYSPAKEAERFVENLNLPYTPSIIIITEPVLSYISVPLKNRFPEIKIGAIRYTDAFNDYNGKFDFVLNYYEHSDFANYLSTRFNEEALLSIYFINWQPSSKAFSEIDKKCWSEIKKALEDAKTLLVTRQYFEKKWLINTFNFIKYIKKPVEIKTPVNKDVLIIASGPSLKPALKIIKENQSSFFIICLSSAIRCCIENEITPDLCISTDGGYWAGEHLKILQKKDIVLALSPESYCPKRLLQKQKILPLGYSDGFSKKLIEKAKLPVIQAQRNGTVSGTSLDFAIQYFLKDIYFTGLDLATGKGFQHTQPNELEANNSIKDNRISTKEKRSSASEFSGASLEIYLNWFKNKKINSTGRKVYRVIENNIKQNELGEIIDIDCEQFQKKIQESSTKNNAVTSAELFIEKEFTPDLKLIKNFFEEESGKPDFKKQFFPLDFVSLSHNTQNEEIKNKIEERYNTLKEKIWKIIND